MDVLYKQMIQLYFQGLNYNVAIFVEENFLAIKMEAK